MMHYFKATILIYMLLCTGVIAKNILTPYDGAPPQFLKQLTAREKALLAEGESINRQIESQDGGSGVRIFRVNAPADKIWQTISNFTRYPEYTNNQIKNAVEYRPRNADNIYVRFCLKASIFKEYNYSIIHNFPMDKMGWGTWSLDQTQKNDIDDIIGFWRVDPVAENPNQSDVTYSIDIRIKGVFNFVKSLLINKGLDEATQWVKKFSVKEMKN